jgi:transcriptional regulator
MAAMFGSQEDDTKRFISKQNVSLIAKMANTNFQEARNAVIEWVRKHKGYIASVT